MGAFLAHRLVQAVVTLLVFMTVTFVIIQAMPGDVTRLYLSHPRIPPEVRQAMAHRLGLDRPLWQQYVLYLRNVLTGNLGVSFTRYPTPVWDLVAERLPRTVTLFLTATLVSFYVGYTLGRVVAWRRGSWLDLAATGVGVALWTAFYPLVALVLMWAFAFRAGWLPLNQFVDPELWRQAPVEANEVFGRLLQNGLLAAAGLGTVYYLASREMAGRSRWLVQLAATAAAVAASLAWWQQSGLARYAWDIVRHMVLPVLALTLIGFGGVMLLMRDAMLETLREDYVVAARARGLPERVVRDRYAARNALLPVVTSLTLSIGAVASGGIVTETLFSWPGIGQLLLESAVAQDYPLALGAFTFTGIFLILAHVVADLLHVALDPRLRVRGGEVGAAGE